MRMFLTSRRFLLQTKTTRHRSLLLQHHRHPTTPFFLDITSSHFAMAAPRFLLLLLLFPLLSAAARSSCSNTTAYRSSKAVYSTNPNFRGACGYNEYGALVNDGLVTGVGRLYKNGRGCGGCYRIRCTDDRYCDTEGITVVVTDQGFAGNGVDFVLSEEAFGALAVPDLADRLLDMGIVDVEFRRASCEYPGHNLTIKVMEQSTNPGYLAIVFLYQGGKCDILSVEVAPATDDCDEWSPMRRAYGAVWDLENCPSGALNLRLLTSDDEDVKWVYLDNVIPEKWKRGRKYDSGIQLSSLGSASSL